MIYVIARDDMLLFLVRMQQHLPPASTENRGVMLKIDFVRSILKFDDISVQLKRSKFRLKKFVALNIVASRQAVRFKFNLKQLILQIHACAWLMLL
jgi:hypothetical protein